MNKFNNKNNDMIYILIIHIALVLLSTIALIKSKKRNVKELNKLNHEK